MCHSARSPNGLGSEYRSRVVSRKLNLLVTLAFVGMGNISSKFLSDIHLCSECLPSAKCDVLFHFSIYSSLLLLLNRDIAVFFPPRVIWCCDWQWILSLHMHYGLLFFQGKLFLSLKSSLFDNYFHLIENGRSKKCGAEGLLCEAMVFKNHH